MSNERRKTDPYGGQLEILTDIMQNQIKDVNSNVDSLHKKLDAYITHQGTNCEKRHNDLYKNTIDPLKEKIDKKVGRRELTGYGTLISGIILGLKNLKFF